MVAQKNRDFMTEETFFLELPEKLNPVLKDQIKELDGLVQQLKTLEVTPPSPRVSKALEFMLDLIKSDKAYKHCRLIQRGDGYSYQLKVNPETKKEQRFLPRLKSRVFALSI